MSAVIVELADAHAAVAGVIAALFVVALILSRKLRKESVLFKDLLLLGKHNAGSVFRREFEIIVFLVDAILWIRAQRWLGHVVLLIIFGSAKSNARHLIALRLLLAL